MEEKYKFERIIFQKQKNNKLGIVLHTKNKEFINEYFKSISKESFKLTEKDQINICKKIRHRIIGTNDYAIVAEIWIHTDKSNPSDENDIIRLQDDFNRN